MNILDYVAQIAAFADNAELAKSINRPGTFCLMLECIEYRLGVLAKVDYLTEA